MNIIRSYQRSNSSTSDKTSRKSRYFLGIVWFFCLTLIAAIVYIGGTYIKDMLSKDTTYTVGGDVEGEQAFNVPSEKSKNTVLRELSDDDFMTLYNVARYPNVQLVSFPPAITEDETLDTLIREQAETRGYRLNSIPISDLLLYVDEDSTSHYLQQPAYDAWMTLKDQAKQDRIPLQLTSAYRSISEQRQLFTLYLTQSGFFNASNDNQKRAIADKVLARVAPPGYSRHHSGYVLDFACDNVGLDGFEDTLCYEWISENNFERSKFAGLIPSYPNTEILQGPEPEPWEFVWVGTELLYE
jgi:LAS superfamily LD-carboxypeptidase LdcB